MSQSHIQCLFLCFLLFISSTSILNAADNKTDDQRELLKQHLVVDHINFAFDLASFEKLKQLTAVFEKTEFSEVKTQQLEYDLVGIMLRDGSYAEFLSRSKDIAEYGFQMAIVWCSSDPEVIDVDVLPNLYPEQEWTGRSATMQDGTEWYTTHQIAPRPAPFTTWGMFYHDRSTYRVLDYRLNPPEGKFTFSEWVEAHARIPPALVADIKKMSIWFPNPVMEHGNQLHIMIPTPNGNVFNLYLHIDDSVQTASLDSLSLRMLDPKLPEKVDGISFDLKDDVLIIDLQ